MRVAVVNAVFCCYIYILSALSSLSIFVKVKCAIVEKRSPLTKRISDRFDGEMREGGKRKRSERKSSLQSLNEILLLLLLNSSRVIKKFSS